MSVSPACPERLAFNSDTLSGLLLLCTWAFSGKKKLLAWLFSLMVSTYFSAMIWAIATYTTVYGRRNMHAYHDDCFASLSTPTRLVTVGKTIPPVADVIYGFQCIIVSGP